MVCQNCSSLSENLHKDNPYNQCVKSCSRGYLFKENHQCYDRCDNIIKTPLFHQDRECVYKCKKHYGRDDISSTVCYNCRSRGKEEEDGFCILCTGHNCFDYTPLSEIDDCENYNCNDHGTCYMKNKQPNCACHENYTGHSCEYNYSVAVQRINDKVDKWENDFMNKNEDSAVQISNNGDLYLNIKSEQVVEDVKEMAGMFKNPKVTKKVGRRKTKQIFHLVGDTIMRMLDGEDDLDSNILYFYDLATNIVISSLEARRITRLRLLDDFEYDDDTDAFAEEEEEIDEKEELENLEDLLNKARKIYKLLTIKDIKDGNFDIYNSTYDCGKERSIYYQRYSNKEK